MTPVMVRVVVRMRPEARVEFPVMEIPLMLDAGSARRQQPFQATGIRNPLKPVRSQ
jgi:general secretion pathway protein J